MTIDIIRREIYERLEVLEKQEHKLNRKEFKENSTTKLCDIHYAQNRVIEEQWILEAMLDTYYEYKSHASKLTREQIKAHIEQDIARRRKK